MDDAALTLLSGVQWRGEPVAGARSQVLLAALAAAAPRTVPAARLAAQVWPDQPPDHPEKALQVLVSRTRSRTDAAVVERSGDGYRLALVPDDVDLLRLRALVARGAAREALDVEVGAAPDEPALAELVYEAQGLRAAAAGLLGEAEVAAGRHEEALRLLEPLLAERPDDEPLVALVLRATAGAQGVPSALQRYARHAEDVEARVGAAPGEELRRLHLELLARDAPVRDGLTHDATPLVGRDDDVAAIRAALAGSRVVSIVGPGGLGKTRMAHLVGHLAEQPVVRLVELAGVTSPEGVLPEMASALGARDSLASARQGFVTTDLRSRVAQQLGGPPTLLVVDNCEHLVAAVADLVGFLVTTVPDLRVLTTSRAPLGLAAEQVYALPQLGRDDAVDLFGRRALAARPGVRLVTEEVDDLVARLDGLPLAIELAAAKVRAMSVADVARRLGDRFTLLRGGDRSAPDRHRTLEAVIDWSWQLLAEGPREALRVLGVFPDGFTLDGADAVLGRDALADVTHLAEQSLVVVQEDDGVRYRFLETVREYAAARREEAGEQERAHASLAAWAVGTARALAQRLYSVDQVEAAREARAEAGNLTGALRRAIATDRVELAVPVAATLSSLWTFQGDHASILALGDTLLDAVAAAGPPGDGAAADERRSTLAALAIGTAVLRGSTPRRAVEQLRRLGAGPAGTRTHAATRVVLALFAGDEPDVAALEELATDPDVEVGRLALIWLCQAQENAGEIELAVQTARRALALVDDGQGPWLRATVETQLAGLAFQSGDARLAADSARRALPTMEALGAWEDGIQLRSAVALSLLAAGDLDGAALAIATVRDDDRARSSLAWTFGAVGIAEVELARGHAERGLALYAEGVAAARDRTFPGLEIDPELSPWVVFTEAAALAAGVQHGRREMTLEAGASLARRLPVLLAEAHRDVPVVGLVMVAVGQWLLTDDALPAECVEPAVRMLALAERFGYYRGIPTLGWERTRAIAERRAPGVVDPMRVEYAGRRATDLLPEAVSVVEVVQTALR